jgi:drug/metabolite transporter (DMT)-like permease
MSIVLACLAGVLFAVNIVTTRQALDRTGVRTDAAAFVTISVAAIVAAAVAAVGGVRLDEFTWEDTRGFILVGAFVPGIAQLTFYAAIRLVGPSRTGVLIGTVPMWSVILATIFLDEQWSVAIVVATILTVVGAGLLAYRDVSESRASRLGIVLATLTALQFGLRDVVARSVTQDSDLHSSGAALVILVVGAGVLMVATFLAAGPTAFADNTRRSLPRVIVPGAAIGFAMPALLGALSRTRVSIVSPLNNASQSVAVVALAGLVYGGAEVSRRVVVAVTLVVVGGTIIGITR